MASRHLRKLQKDDFMDMEDEVESPEARRDAKPNLFSLLNEVGMDDIEIYIWKERTGPSHILNP